MKKIKNRESLHPGSRKAEQVTRVNLRLNKLDQKKKAMNTEKTNKSGYTCDCQIFLSSLIVARYHYLANRLSALDSQPSKISIEDIHSLVKQFIDRDDDLYNDLKSERESRDKKLKRSAGKSSKEGEIDVRKERELSEFKSGFSRCTYSAVGYLVDDITVVPDLTDEITMHLFKQFPSARKLSKKAKGKTQSSGVNQDNSMAIDNLDDDELSKHGLDINYLPQLKLIRVYMDQPTKSDLVQFGQNPIYKN